MNLDSHLWVTARDTSEEEWSNHVLERKSTVRMSNQHRMHQDSRFENETMALEHLNEVRDDFILEADVKCSEWTHILWLLLINYTKELASRGHQVWAKFAHFQRLRQSAMKLLQKRMKISYNSSVNITILQFTWIACNEEGRIQKTDITTCSKRASRSDHVGVSKQFHH